MTSPSDSSMDNHKSEVEELLALIKRKQFVDAVLLAGHLISNNPARNDIQQLFQESKYYLKDEANRLFSEADMHISKQEVLSALHLLNRMKTHYQPVFEKYNEFQAIQKIISDKESQSRELWLKIEGEAIEEKFLELVTKINIDEFDPEEASKLRARCRSLTEVHKGFYGRQKRFEDKIEMFERRYREDNQETVSFRIRIAERKGVPARTRLTPVILEKLVSLLKVINDIENILHDLCNKPPVEIAVGSLNQNSSVSVSVYGADYSIKILSETLQKTRREYAACNARLASLRGQVKNAAQQAQLTEKRARAEKDYEEAEKLDREVARQRRAAQQLVIQLKQLEVELQREKFGLAHAMIHSAAPGLSESESYPYVNQLMPSIEYLLTCPFEIS